VQIDSLLSYRPAEQDIVGVRHTFICSHILRFISSRCHEGGMFICGAFRKGNGDLPAVSPLFQEHCVKFVIVANRFLFIIKRI